VALVDGPHGPGRAAQDAPAEDHGLLAQLVLAVQGLLQAAGDAVEVLHGAPMGRGRMMMPVPIRSARVSFPRREAAKA
jgi:hypothetical protein